jgi:alpha-beta hydrolase superfamily lysophospholipase
MTSKMADNTEPRRRALGRRIGLRLLFYYLLYVVAAFFLQSHLVFPGQRRKASRDAAWPAGRTEHWTIETTAARVPAALLWPENTTPTAVIVVGHGNAELIEDWIDLADLLSERGAAVLLVEYPGYGEATGRPSRKTLDAVFIKAREMIEEQPQLSGLPVAGLGRSIGSGPICELARKGLLNRVALLAPFERLDGLVHRMGLPASLLRTRYDNGSALREFPGALWIAHGVQDRVIPPDHSSRLADRAGGPVELRRIEAGHNDLLWEAGADLWEEMAEFLVDGPKHDPPSPAR